MVIRISPGYGRVRSGEGYWTEIWFYAVSWSVCGESSAQDYHAADSTYSGHRSRTSWSTEDSEEDSSWTVEDAERLAQARS